MIVNFRFEGNNSQEKRTMHVLAIITATLIISTRLCQILLEMNLISSLQRPLFQDV